MATTVVFEGQVEIPLTLRSLADFRRWATSDEFPEQGRIDYVAGRIEVDMSPEELFCHGTLKGEILSGLYRLVKPDTLGYLFVSRARISSMPGDVSAEPDVVFLSHETLDSGGVRLVPKAGGPPRRYVEMEGGPDLVVEIVSDPSVNKDTRLLPEAYFKAGVREYWLADARVEPLVFQIHRRGPSGFEPVEPDGEGYQGSSVFGRRFRLDGHRDARGMPAFDLRVGE